MKGGNTTPLKKNKTARIKKITGKLVSYLMCQKYLKNVCIKICPTFLKIYFQNVSVGLEGTKCTTLFNKIKRETARVHRSRLRVWGIIKLPF